MSIQHAMLGILSYKPMTGYDLKKRMQDSPYMHWSGNNNQIYKALLELSEDGFVTSETVHQDGAPSKKIYTVTEAGLRELRKHVAGEPEPAELRKPFLVQLAWADLLVGSELQKLLEDYENEVRLQLIMCQEKIRRGGGLTARTEREAFLWHAIDKNILDSWKCELTWIQDVRKQLGQYEAQEEVIKLKYEVLETGGVRYVEVLSGEPPLRTEQDALELVGLCGEKDTNRLLLRGEALSEDFFRLKTGVAGAMLQKLVNYSVKTAVIIPAVIVLGERFQELRSEVNKGSQYRFFTDSRDAEIWLRNEG